MSYAKPLPIPDSESRPFWEGTKEHKLLMQRSPTTGKFQFPPTTFTPGGLERPEWVEVSGRGKVFSWIVVRAPTPADVYAADVPYTVALIELDEGVRMASNIVNCAPEDVTDGMKVKVLYKQVTDEITLPLFEPA